MSLELIKNADKYISKCEWAQGFWEIIDLLKQEFDEDNKGFYCNRTTLLEAYTKGKFFTLHYGETDKLYEQRSDLIEHIIYPFGLKCFCILDENNEIEIIWTAKPY